MCTMMAELARGNVGNFADAARATTYRYAALLVPRAEPPTEPAAEPPAKPPAKPPARRATGRQATVRVAQAVAYSPASPALKALSTAET